MSVSPNAPLGDYFDEWRFLSIITESITCLKLIPVEPYLLNC